MLLRIALVWASNSIAFLVADLLIDGIRFDEEWRFIIAGAVFGLVNWLVKPIVQLLALPLIIITLGIALFFINLLMLYLTSWVISDFYVDSFGAAIGGTIVIWLVNVVLLGVFGLTDRQRRRRAGVAARR